MDDIKGESGDTGTKDAEFDKNSEGCSDMQDKEKDINAENTTQMDKSDIPKMDDIKGESGDIGTKDAEFNKNSEGCSDMQDEEKDINAENTTQMDKSDIPQSVGKPSQDITNQQNVHIKKEANALPQMSDYTADIKNKISPDNDCKTTSQDNDTDDESQYSHAVTVDDVRISLPGKGNLKIIEVDSTELGKSLDKDLERHETDVTAKNAENVREPANGGTDDNSPYIEKEEALAALRMGQTYDEEEDYGEFENYDEYIENYNKAKEKFVYFWKSHDIYSQWHRSDFFVNGKKFCNAEQYMMYQKAVLFDDGEIAKQILNCKDPKKIKALGRKVQGFDQNKWQQECLYIVRDGNMAKFLQNEKLLADILFTYPKTLVEASPLDCIWGIGLTEDDPAAWDESTWQGTNYLGYVLMEVRDDIMVERGMIDEVDRKRYIDNLLVSSDVPMATSYYDEHKGETGGKGKQQDRYTVENIENPTANRETYLLFDKGIYSQFYRTYFTVDKIEFSCAEQYMMYKKAKLFNDNQTAKEILNKTEPKEIKHLGRQVKGFKEEVWRKHCLHIVKKGNLAKFSQNERLKKAIVTTYPKVFAEANQYDRVWGIGLKSGDPKAERRNTWQGKNFLGFVLTEVRDELMCEWGLIKKEKISKYIEQLQKDWVDDVTRNNHDFKMSHQTPHSRATDADDTREKRHDEKNPDNKDRFRTKGKHKDRQPMNIKDDRRYHNEENKYHDDRYHGNRDDNCKNVHQKQNDQNNRDHSDSSQQKGASYQHHGGNFKKHDDKHGDNADGNYNKKQPDQTNSSPRHETEATNAERQLSVKDVKDQGAEIGQRQEANTDRANKPSDKNEKSSKKGRKKQKRSKDIEKQEIIVEEFDLDAVMASFSSNAQAVEQEAQSQPTKKEKGKKQTIQQNVFNSEEVQTAAVEDKPGKKLSKRQKKNVNKRGQ